MTLTRKSGLKRTGFLKRSGKLKKSNPERQAKRRKANAKYYASAEWKAIRLETFERDGWQCTAMRELYDMPGTLRRCAVVDESRTGRGLVCDEESYAHRGRPGKTPKTRTLCTRCSEIETVRLRANHMQGFNNGRRR